MKKVFEKSKILNMLRFLLEFDKFPFRVVRRSTRSSIDSPSSEATFDILNSFQLEGEVSAMLLAAPKNTIFAPKLAPMAARTSNGARTRMMLYDV